MLYIDAGWFRVQQQKKSRVLNSRKSLFLEEVMEASHEGAVRPEDVRVALAVHVLGVALDAVAAVDLR